MNEPLVLPDLDDAAVITGDALAKRCAHFVFEKKRAEKIAQELDKRELAFSRLKIDRVFVDKDFTICCRTESELKDGGLPLTITVKESIVEAWAHDPAPGDVLLNVSGVVSGFSTGKGVSLEVKPCGIEGPGINPTDDIKTSEALVSCLSRIPEDLRVAAFARICRRLRGQRIDFRNCFCITSLKRNTYRADLAAERLGTWACPCVRMLDWQMNPMWDITLGLALDRRCKVTVQGVGSLKKLSAYDVLSGFGVKSVSGIVRIESEGLVLTKERFREEDVAAIWGKAGPDGR